MSAFSSSPPLAPSGPDSAASHSKGVCFSYEELGTVLVTAMKTHKTMRSEAEFETFVRIKALAAYLGKLPKFRQWLPMVDCCAVYREKLDGTFVPSSGLDFMQVLASGSVAAQKGEQAKKSKREQEEETQAAKRQKYESKRKIRQPVRLVSKQDADSGDVEKATSASDKEAGVIDEE